MRKDRQLIFSDVVTHHKVFCLNYILLCHLITEVIVSQFCEQEVSRWHYRVVKSSQTVRCSIDYIDKCAISAALMLETIFQTCNFFGQTQRHTLNTLDFHENVNKVSRDFSSGYIQSGPKIVSHYRIINNRIKW